jgi:tRNA(fMet)-specific endonuclease VapC
VTGKYLLDTNIVSAILAKERVVLQRLGEIDYRIPAVVVGELYAWAFSPTQKRERLSLVRGFLSVVPVLRRDITTGERYGMAFVDFTRGGLKIPVNGLWIAALALQRDYTVATRDSDFNRVTGL